MNWKIKGITQKILSDLPGGTKLNTGLQRVLGGRRNFDAEVEEKVVDWTLSVKYLSDAGISIQGARLMEIGTGWYPFLPAFFVLAGAESVATFDIVPLMSENILASFLNSLKKSIPSIANALQLSQELLNDRLARFCQSSSLTELLNNAHIEYFAPADARFSGLAPESIDIVYSNSVLEHVPKQAIRQLMEESLRVLKPGGVILHNVACNDHYANFDKSISYVNFLQFSEKQWKLWNNSLQYQNRLRASEFLQLTSDAGFQIVARRSNIRPGVLEALKNMRIAPEFRSFSETDLAATTIDIVGCKPLQETGSWQHTHVEQLTS